MAAAKKKTPPKARRKRALPPEEHDNHERWMVTYADMVTLLMVLFIVMFAMSSVDQKKYTALRSGLAEGFGQTTSLLSGTSALLDHGGSQLDESALNSAELAALSPQQKLAVKSAVDQAVAESAQQKLERMWAEASAEVNRLQEIEAALRETLRKAGLGSDVRSSIDDRGLVLSLVSHQVVFQANLATLSPRGARVVDTLAPHLRRLSEELRIDGHTNQVAVKPKYYDTDWDLSAARAITVLRRLHELGGVPQERMSASAFGREQPLVDPDLPGSQEINKRVDIIVVSGLSAGSRALMDEVVRGGDVADRLTDDTRGDRGKSGTDKSTDRDSGATAGAPLDSDDERRTGS
ncbi:OmpA/MotB family protein [Nocardioides ferulae]|uniref:OmpA/MotB family protein n=1 Tax=Nocardioides ferulae TaxID=2340821 RepID=UPI000EB36A5B|nr:flagellar motor protein MotB [Nocardioides ferulae]